MLEKTERILNFIANYIKKKKYSPSLRNIKDGAVISSTSVVSYHLEILESTGYIERDENISRSISLTDKGSEFHKEGGQRK